MGFSVRPTTREKPRPDFVGPAPDDDEVLERIPGALRSILEARNGYILYGGGLHIRGASREPTWHSLREAWLSPRSVNLRYPEVGEDDIPFAQDCLGDQFLLRGRDVLRLRGETGEIEELGVRLGGFLLEVEERPEEFLELHPLIEYRARGGKLVPGQLLAAFPPFCTEEAEEGVSLRAIPCEERLEFLADLAGQLAAVADGERFGLAGPEF